MNKLLAFTFITAFSSLALADLHTFTDTKGRSISAEIIFATEDSVTIKRKDGKTFTVPSSSFSEEDQIVIAEWINENEAKLALQKSAADAIAKRQKIATFCIEKKGKKVGNGECWTLADAAYKASKAKRPKGGNRVWGRLVDFKKEKIEPGDIIEFRKAKISEYGTTGPVHTAVAIKGGRSQRCTIAEQNWGNVKKVRFVKLDLRGIQSGQVMVYRLEK